MNKMKRDWGAPRTEIQRFAPQEFCAVCFDKQDSIPEGEYYFGWLIREAEPTTGLLYGNTGDGRMGYFLKAPDVIAAGDDITKITEGITSRPGSWVETNFPGYTWYDLNNEGRTYLSKGDLIQYDGHSFKMDGSSTTALAHPSASFYKVSGHS